MKKMFFAMCGVLPGGMVLLAAMMTFAACARFQYETSAKHWIQGTTTSPETVMMAEAEAYAMRKCADNPENCRAVELSQTGPWGAGMMDTPAGYTWAGIRAAGVNKQTNAPDVRKDLARIEKKVDAMDKGQDAFFRILKNRKGKR